MQNCIPRLHARTRLCGVVVMWLCGQLLFVSVTAVCCLRRLSYVPHHVIVRATSVYLRDCGVLLGTPLICSPSCDCAGDFYLSPWLRCAAWDASHMFPVMWLCGQLLFISVTAVCCLGRLSYVPRHVIVRATSICLRECGVLLETPLICSQPYM
jgi:hypothetical protein